MDKIICVGKNYSEHAKELGDAVPERPVLFLKPPSVLREAKSGETLTLAYPKDAGSLHHETEVVLRLAKDGRIDAVTLGLDMTLRDRQAQLKKNGHPWEIAKVFRDSAVVGPWVKPSAFTGWETAPFSLAIDGKIRQQGHAGQMVYDALQCVKYAAEFFPLCEGDLLFTGTPAGVGPVEPGSRGQLSWGPVAYAVTWKA